MDGMTLEDMKSFDFTIPMNETIIFDDSDEDENSTVIIKKEKIQTNDQQENPSDCRSMPIIDAICSVETSSVKNKRDSSCILNNNEEELKKRKTVIYKNVDQPARSQHFNQKNNALADENETSQNNDHEMYQNEGEKNICNVDASCSVDETICQTPKPNVLKTEETVEFSSIQQNKENFEELSDYIKDILDTISENLILTVEEYRQHLINISKPHQTNITVKNSQKRYLAWKQHYYHLSYVAVINIIFTEEKKNNTKFTEDFLNKTVKYAKDKMNLTYSKQDIQPFYYELIAWAIKKQKSLKHAQAKTVQGDSLVNLSNHIKEKYIIQNNAQVTSTAQNDILRYPNLRRFLTPKTNVTQIFTGGAPEREIAISVDTAALEAFQNVANRNVSAIENRYPIQNQEMFNPHPSSVTAVSKSRELNQNQVYTFSIPRDMNINHNNFIQYNSPHIANGPNRPDFNKHYQRNQLPPYDTLQTSNAQPQQFVVDYDKYLSQVTLLPQQAPRLSQPQYHTNTTEQLQQNGRQLQQNGQQLQQNPQQLQQNGLQSLTTQLEHSRSSVSTDSGFASPRQFNGADNAVPPSDDTQSVPIITHVTSLNPQAQYIPAGKCYVCNVPSHTKCLGCMQKYYCSSHCQAKDWSVHRIYCGKILGNNNPVTVI